MAEQQAVVGAYLLPASEACWCWSSDGSAVSWAGGGVMALREEIDAVLGRLAPAGLPPFGAVALLLAATREDWGETGGGRAILTRYVRHLVQRASRPSVPSMRPGGGIRIDMRRRAERSVSPVARIDAMVSAFENDLGPGRSDEDLPIPRLVLPGAAVVAEVLDGLDRVRALPFELTGAAEGKAVLAEVVFEEAGQRLPAVASLAVAAAVADGTAPAAMRQWQSKRDVVAEFLSELELLRRGLATLNEERLRMRLRTGLDGTVEPAGDDRTPADRVRALVASLMADKELSGLARLARDLMAVLQLPRSLALADELPVGGYSDISNRGPLDRLLVSELAHDDLTLAARVALNEALYLRREIPRRDPPVCRGILLDSGIRVWGVPRVFVTAVGLALAATSGKREFLVFRAKGESIHPVDLLTKEGLVAQLEALEPEPHPGRALARFMETVAQGTDGTEAILVTHADALEDPELQSALAALDGGPIFLASVDREGEFHLWQQTGKWRRSLSEAKLQLQSVLTPAGNRPQPLPVSGPASDGLPLLLSISPFPFMLPAPIKFPAAAVTPERELVSWTADGRMLHWQDPQRGPRQLDDRVPPGRLLGAGMGAGRTAWAAFAPEAGGGRIPALIADLSTGQVTRRELQAGADDPSAVVAIEHALLAFFPDRVDAFEPGSGEKLAELDKLPAGLCWKNGRFLGGEKTWAALSVDGHSILVHELKQTRPRTIAMFDRPDGPWGIEADGAIYSTLDGSRKVVAIPAREPLSFLGINTAQDRIALAAVGLRGRSFVLHLDDMGLRPSKGDPWRTLEPSACARGRTRGRFELRSRFKSIAFLGESIWLQAEDGAIVRIDADAAGGARPRRVPAPPGFEAARRNFKSCRGLAGTRYRLSMATWESGARAFLDSRGLLHLCPAAERTPEVSLTVAQSPISGWSSDGQLYGLGYLLDRTPNATGGMLLEAIRRLSRRFA